MRWKIELINFTIFCIVLSGCFTKDNYSIERVGLSSKNSGVESFSISQFKSDSQSKEDIRPVNHTEVMRFCCEVKKGKKALRRVLFSDTSNYRWSLCLLDTSIVTNDSLNKLSDEEKRRYIKEQNIANGLKGKSDFQIPFVIQRGYVYQLFGLDNLDGSFYFRLSDQGDLKVQFFESGPW